MQEFPGGDGILKDASCIVTSLRTFHARPCPSRDAIGRRATAV
ncbi:MAG: hypothetical protein IAF94_26220 [Pirellulaceae bacterium]|nr:hypothetical protein [Pirellulaceae bacterium]